MPNWCSNDVTITFENATQEQVEILRGLETAFKGGRLLEHICPLGEWDYHKAVQTWGTKWDVGSESDTAWLKEIEGAQGKKASLWLEFYSAWSPPIEAFVSWAEGLSEQTNLEIDGFWSEPGLDSIGYWNANGLIEEESFSDTIRDMRRGKCSISQGLQEYMLEQYQSEIEDDDESDDDDESEDGSEGVTEDGEK